jgi:hypothetical protein
MGEADQVAGAQRCCYGSDHVHCGLPATVHVLLDTDGNPTMSCPEHAGWWDTHPYHDQHPIMAVCGLPGTTWLYAQLSKDGFTPSRCVIEDIDDPSLSESAKSAQHVDELS